MSNQALLNINQIAARKGAAELEFAVKKVNSLDKSKGGPEGYLKAIERRVEDLVFDEVQKFQKEDNLLIKATEEFLKPEADEYKPLYRNPENIKFVITLQRDALASL